MKLTTESTLEQMAASILGEFDGSTPDDGVEANMQSSWGQHFSRRRQDCGPGTGTRERRTPSGGGTVPDGPTALIARPTPLK